MPEEQPRSAPAPEPPPAPKNRKKTLEAKALKRRNFKPGKDRNDATRVKIYKKFLKK